MPCHAFDCFFHHRQQKANRFMKHQLSAIVLAHTLAMTTGSAAFAQASADISQTGQGNAAYAEQVENSNGSIAAVILQSGSNNRAGDPDSGTVSATTGGIWQKDNHGDTSAKVNQTGNGNLLRISQDGVTNKYARIAQIGNSNTGAIVQQSGNGGGAVLSQSGDDHNATITVKAGDFNPIYNSGYVQVSQSSRGNRAEVVHAGPGNTRVVQAGDNNTARLDSVANLFSGLSLEQYGRDNTASVTSLGFVRQYGDRNSAALLGFVQGFRGAASDYNIRGDITQMGSDNSARIDQRPSVGGGFAFINQAGSSNVASIETGGRYQGTTQIEQRGFANTATILQTAFQAGNISVSQQGSGHRSTVQQKGFALEQASTAQTGGNNTADIVQAGYLYNDAMIIQDGYRNRAVVAQGSSESYSNVARIYQQGNDFQAAIYQNGAGNRAAIRQR
jgi:hypothetical protein